MRSKKIYMGLALALLSSTSVFAAQTADERIKQLEAEINKLKAEKATLVKNPKAYVAPTTPVASATAPKGQFTWTGFYAGINGGYDWSNGKGGKSGLNTNQYSEFSNQYVTPDTTNTVTGSADSINTEGLTIPADRNLNMKRSSIMGGLQGGYNKQLGNFVFGFEADLMGFHAKKSSSATDGFTGTTDFIIQAGSTNGLGTANNSEGYSNSYTGNGVYTQSKSLQQDWLGTLRARAGFGLDKALLFVSAGPAFGNAKAAVSQKLTYVATDTTPLGAGEDIARNSTRWDGVTDQTRIGFALGAGGEYAITDNWILRAEYMYYNLGTVKMNLHQSWDNQAKNTGGICNDPITCSGSPFAATNKTSSTKVDGNIVRAAVNYKF